MIRGIGSFLKELLEDLVGEVVLTVVACLAVAAATFAVAALLIAYAWSCTCS